MICLCSCFIFGERKGDMDSQLCLSCHHSPSLEVFFLVFVLQMKDFKEYEVPQHAFLGEYLTFCFKDKLVFVSFAGK